MSPPFAETTIEINAPVALVWKIMLDVRQYPDWNPFIIRVETPANVLSVGSRLVLHIRWANGSGMRSAEKVTQIEPPTSTVRTRRRAVLAYRFNGWLHTLGLVRSTRLQWLEQGLGQPTTYRTREEFRGLLAAAVPLRDVQDGFERHAQALKVWAEQLRSAGAQGGYHRRKH